MPSQTKSIPKDDTSERITHNKVISDEDYPILAKKMFHWNGLGDPPKAENMLCIRPARAGILIKWSQIRIAGIKEYETGASKTGV